MNTPYTASPTMRDLIFLRGRGTRENPHSMRTAGIINGMPNRIPNNRSPLPFINDMGRCAHKRKRGASPHRVEIAAAINIRNAFRLRQ